LRNDCLKISILAGSGDGAVQVLHLEVALEAGGDVLPGVLDLALVIRPEVVPIDLPSLQLKVVLARLHVVHRTLLLIELPDQHVLIALHREVDVLLRVLRLLHHCLHRLHAQAHAQRIGTRLCHHH